MAMTPKRHCHFFFKSKKGAYQNKMKKKTKSLAIAFTCIMVASPILYEGVSTMTKESSLKTLETQNLKAYAENTPKPNGSTFQQTSDFIKIHAFSEYNTGFTIKNKTHVMKVQTKNQHKGKFDVQSGTSNYMVNLSSHVNGSNKKDVSTKLRMENKMRDNVMYDPEEKAFYIYNDPSNPPSLLQVTSNDDIDKPHEDKTEIDLTITDVDDNDVPKALKYIKRNGDYNHIFRTTDKTKYTYEITHPKGANVAVELKHGGIHLNEDMFEELKITPYAYKSSTYEKDRITTKFTVELSQNTIYMMNVKSDDEWVLDLK